MAAFDQPVNRWVVEDLALADLVLVADVAHGGGPAVMEVRRLRAALRSAATRAPFFVLGSFLTQMPVILTGAQFRQVAAAGGDAKWRELLSQRGELSWSLPEEFAGRREEWERRKAIAEQLVANAAGGAQPVMERDLPRAQRDFVRALTPGALPGSRVDWGALRLEERDFGGTRAWALAQRQDLSPGDVLAAVVPGELLPVVCRVPGVRMRVVGREGGLSPYAVELDAENWLRLFARSGVTWAAFLASSRNFSTDAAAATGVAHGAKRLLPEGER